MTQIVNSFREQNQRRAGKRIGKRPRGCSAVKVYRPTKHPSLGLELVEIIPASKLRHRTS